MFVIYLQQTIGISVLLKLFGPEEVTDLSLKILCESINSIPLLMNRILINSFCALVDCIHPASGKFEKN